MTHRHPRPRCRPPPLSLTHMHKYTNTPTQILISTSNLHSFRNISPVFSSPAEQMLAVCVSLPLDYTNRLPEVFFFALHRFFSASSPVKQFVHVPSYLLCDFAVDHYFTLSCFTLKPSPPLSKHSYLQCLPTCATACSLKPHLLFTTNVSLIISPSWWILSSRSSCRHSAPLLCFFSFFSTSLQQLGDFSPCRLSETPPSPFLPASCFVLTFVISA